MNIIHNIPSYIKVEPYGRTEEKSVTAYFETEKVQVAGGEDLDFYFPKGYIDLTSLSMMFRYMNIGLLSGTNQVLPKDTECLIDRLEVWLGDRKVNDIANYNQIFFILSMFAMKAEFTDQRNSFRNVYTNGRPALSANLNNVRFCCDKWLGLLGEKIVLDTHTLGQLHIKITLAQSYITSSSNTNNSYGIKDVYMKVKYYENYNGELPKYIEYDNFKSIKEQRTSYNQKTDLIVECSKIDYVLARVMFETHYIKSVGFNADIQSTNHFVSRGENIGSWNILVNNNPIFKFRPDNQDALNVMFDLFPDKAKNYGALLGTETAVFNRSWTCGAELGFVNEKNEQVQISFTTEPSSLTSSQNNYPLLIVKFTSSIEITDGGIKYMF